MIRKPRKMGQLRRKNKRKMIRSSATIMSMVSGSRLMRRLMQRITMEKKRSRRSLKKILMLLRQKREPRTI